MRARATLIIAGNHALAGSPTSIPMVTALSRRCLTPASRGHSGDLPMGDSGTLPERSCRAPPHPLGGNIFQGRMLRQWAAAKSRVFARRPERWRGPRIASFRSDDVFGRPKRSRPVLGRFSPRERWTERTIVHQGRSHTVGPPESRGGPRVARSPEL